MGKKSRKEKRIKVAQDDARGENGGATRKRQREFGTRHCKLRSV
jgi:hypothetical protein